MMPRVSQFFGIVIAIYFNDHAPPHFHARYGEFEVVMGIENLEILESSMPKRALGLLWEWAGLHRGELIADWDLARKGLPLNLIEPLR